MIKNEQYTNFLKSIISCVSHGDYYSIKELSQLELEKMNKIEEENKKNMKKKIRFNMNNQISMLEKEELIKLIQSYSIHTKKQIEKSISLEILKREFLTIEEYLRIKENI